MLSIMKHLESVVVAGIAGCIAAAGLSIDRVL